MACSGEELMTPLTGFRTPSPPPTTYSALLQLHTIEGRGKTVEHQAMGLQLDLVHSQSTLNSGTQGFTLRSDLPSAGRIHCHGKKNPPGEGL